MRFALLGVLASAAIAVATSANTIAASPATTLSVAWTSSPSAVENHSSVLSFPVSQPSNMTTHFTTTVVPTARPNATASHTAEVAGGAIPQQMQASIVGLLGFCIMGLVML